MKKIYLGAALILAFLPASIQPAAWQPSWTEKTIGYGAAALIGGLCCYAYYIDTHKPITVPPKKVVNILNFTNGINLTNFATSLIALAKDDTCAGIILKIDHSGGAFASFSVIHDLVKKIAIKKPIITLVTDQAASCAYLVASATHHIIAHSGSDLGGIGIYITLDHYSNKQLTKENVKLDFTTELVRAGEYKALWHPDLNKADLEKASSYHQDQINITYQQFAQTVASNRNLDISQINVWADGKSFIAPLALELGLIDQIGTQFDAEEKMAELLDANIKNIQFIEHI